MELPATSRSPSEIPPPARSDPWRKTIPPLAIDEEPLGDPARRLLEGKGLPPHIVFNGESQTRIQRPRLLFFVAASLPGGEAICIEASLPGWGLPTGEAICIAASLPGGEAICIAASLSDGETICVAASLPSGEAICTAASLPGGGVDLFCSFSSRWGGNLHCSLPPGRGGESPLIRCCSSRSPPRVPRPASSWGLFIPDVQQVGVYDCASSRRKSI